MKTRMTRFYAVLHQRVLPHQLHAFRDQFRELGPMIYNRDEKGIPIYGYPQIQFRVHRGHGAVFAINEGAHLMHQWVLQNPDHIMGPDIWQEHELKLVPMKAARMYRTFHWIPMDERYFKGDIDILEQQSQRRNKRAKVPALANGDAPHLLIEPYTLPVPKVDRSLHHIPQWNAIPMADKVKTLERILVSNIIEFAQVCQWKISERKLLRVRLHDIHRIHSVDLYGDKVLAFDISYFSNAVLPDHTGLGRGKSLGYGWQLTSKHQPGLGMPHPPSHQEL